MATSYERFIDHRAKAQRAIGKHLVEVLLAGLPIDHYVGDDGHVKGTDMTPEALIALCGASRSRISAALRAHREGRKNRPSGVVWKDGVPSIVAGRL